MQSDRNALTVLRNGTFEGLNAVSGSLDLAHNGIQIIEPGAFVGLRSLTMLRLHMNDLWGLQTNTFLGLENLKELHLQGNTFWNIETIQTGRLPGLIVSIMLCSLKAVVLSAVLCTRRANCRSLSLAGRVSRFSYSIYRHDRKRIPCCLLALPPPPDILVRCRPSPDILVCCRTRIDDLILPI